MAESNAENLVARLLSGELSEAEARQLQRQIDADPAARAALARQQATIAALRQWRDGQPSQPIPAGMRHPRWRRFALPALASAAALLLAVGLYFALPSSRAPSIAHVGGARPDTHAVAPTPEAPPAKVTGFGGAAGAAHDAWARDTFAFLLDAGPKPPGGSAIRPGSSTVGGPGSGKVTRTGPELGGGSHGGSKGGPPSTVNVEKLRSRVDFAFRLPRALPQGYALQDATPLSRQVLRLKYTAGARFLLVWLKPSAGPDAPVAVLTQVPAGRAIFALRQRGLGVAMQGGTIDRAFVDACGPDFVPQP